ncbi:MAG: acyl-CoA synthetase [Alphaproteobacteria bacterium]
MHAPTRPIIRSLADIREIEKTPCEKWQPYTSTYEALADSAREFADRDALIFLPEATLEAEPARYTYRDFFARITQAANMFRALGVEQADGVVFLLPAIPEAKITLWGAEAAGRACPINFMLQAEHIAELINYAKAKVLVAFGPHPQLDIWSKIDFLRQHVPNLKAILQVGGPPDRRPGILQFSEELAKHPSDKLAFARKFDKSDIAAYFHTGGTTGAPKLAQHTHANQLHTATFASFHYDLNSSDVVTNGFPIFHVAGSLVFGLSVFLAGATIVQPTALGARSQDWIRNHWKLCAKYGATMLCGGPTTMAAIMAVPVDGADISRIRAQWAGGSPLPKELAAQFEAKLGIPVRDILGMTECAGIVTISPLHAPRVPGSTGFPIPYTRVKAEQVDGEGRPTGVLCTPGEPGVIMLTGPHVSPGYTDTRRNAGMFTDDGWIVGGDLGHLDADGRVYITGRAKDVIIRGGHNIDPAMIEEAIEKHPAIALAAAIGQPDAYAGELPVLYVTLKPGAQATEAEFLDYLRERIFERPALPKRVTVLDELPTTLVGKIFKPKLRMMAIERTFGEVLAEAGIETRVTAYDSGGGLKARIALPVGTDRAAFAEKLKALLGGFHIPHEIV